MNGNQITVILPSLGEGVTEATISRWLVAAGDQINAEDPLLEVSTDKVDTEVPSPHPALSSNCSSRRNPWHGCLVP